MQLFCFYRTGEIEIRTSSVAHTLRCRRVTRFHVGKSLHGSGPLNRFFNKLRTVTALLGTPLRSFVKFPLFLDKQPGREHEQACSHPEQPTRRVAVQPQKEHHNREHGQKEYMRHLDAAIPTDGYTGYKRQSQPEKRVLP